MGLDHVRSEIEHMRIQVGRQRKEILQLQRAGISTASVELLLTRMLAKSLHPVSTAGSSLARFRAGKQTGIGFIDLDELGEVIDAEACKGGCRFFAEAENSETTVFRIQYDADLVQPLLILAEHFSDTADREDVADPGHGQAA